jgi:hypothetical protein
MGKKAKQTKNIFSDKLLNELTKLIESPTPDWQTVQVYSEYLSQFKTLKTQLNEQFKLLVGDTFNISYGKLPEVNKVHNSIVISVGAEILYKFWKEDRIISPPSTGQDPKKYAPTHLENAGFHAGWHWGHTRNGSDWRNAGTVNMVMYPNKQIYLETTDFEHRIVGIIGFILGGVKLKSDDFQLQYHNPRIKREIEPGIFADYIFVNNMTLMDIVAEANKYTDGVSVIKPDDVLKRFYETQIDITVLAMYDEEQCHIYYKQQNSSSDKTVPQLMHADTRPSTFWLKQISSIKLEKFKAADYKLHPFLNLFSYNSKIKLETFMVAHLVTQYTIRNGFVPSNDKPIKNSNIESNGYKSNFNDNLKETIIKQFDILYNFFSKIHKPTLSRQHIQLILHINKWIEDKNKVICDMDLFANELHNFIERERVNPVGGPNPGAKTNFGIDLAAGSVNAHKSAFIHIEENFLNKYLLDDTTSKSIGVCKKSNEVPRLFTKDVVLNSFNKNLGKDIDGNSIDGNPVGGHIISDSELIRMTTDERIQAFKSENLGDKFKFELNCRAMSTRHNLRMSVLRLSEYLEIINESDDYVKAKVNEKKQYLQNKPILV